MASEFDPTKRSIIATSRQAIVELLSSYHELNVDFVDELADPPSPLQFMRYVAANRPFIVRKGISHWPALSKWNSKYLREMMGSTSVEVAVTPLGSASFLVTHQRVVFRGCRNADSIVRSHTDGLLYLAMPLKIHEPFNIFLNHLTAQELHHEQGNVRYAQTRTYR